MALIGGTKIVIIPVYQIKLVGRNLFIFFRIMIFLFLTNWVLTTFIKNSNISRVSEEITLHCPGDALLKQKNSQYRNIALLSRVARERRQRWTEFFYAEEHYWGGLNEGHQWDFPIERSTFWKTRENFSRLLMPFILVLWQFTFRDIPSQESDIYSLASKATLRLAPVAWCA